jgi:hypothetical protein
MTQTLATTGTNHTIIPMTLETAKEKAPGIFSPGPHKRLSKDYKFISSLDLIGHLDTQGWQLTNAKQSKSSNELYNTYGTHIMEFQNNELYMKDNRGGIEGRPTIVVINNSNGDRPLSLDAGIFRLVCSNGLIIKTTDFGSMKERHIKYTQQELNGIVDQKITDMEKAVGKINIWNHKEMTDKQRFQFATEALALRLADDRKPEQYEILDLLQPRRKEDQGKSLWLTYNVVQEGLIKGGFSLNERVARAIKNPMTDFQINQELWTLAEKYELAHS